MWSEYNMWNFERPSNWYDRDDEDVTERRCRRCEEQEQTFDRAADWLEEIVNVIYGTETIDINNLENALDELCHLLKVPMKVNAEGPNIMRRNDVKPLYIISIENLNKRIQKKGDK